MSETEWNNCTDPEIMLGFIRGPKSSMNRPVVATHRQLILWACGCCRRIAHLFHDARYLSAVLAAEGFADGELTYKELMAIGASASKWPETYYKSGKESVTAFVAQSCMHLVEGVDSAFDGMETAFLLPAGDATRWAVAAVWDNAGEHAAVREKNTQCSILRDVLGNPFRPCHCPADWLTPAVNALANEIYSDRCFCKLPELGAALIEAGCDNDNLLRHCRSDDPHVRGCWVVDMFQQRPLSLRWT